MHHTHRCTSTPTPSSSYSTPQTQPAVSHESSSYRPLPSICSHSSSSSPSMHIYTLSSPPIPHRDLSSKPQPENTDFDANRNQTTVSQSRSTLCSLKTETMDGFSFIPVGLNIWTVISLENANFFVPPSTQKSRQRGFKSRLPCERDCRGKPTKCNYCECNTSKPPDHSDMVDLKFSL